MGGKLGTIFTPAGHELGFSHARSNDKVKNPARDAQGDARAGMEMSLTAGRII
jgi:hypothetical protein